MWTLKVFFTNIGFVSSNFPVWTQKTSGTQKASKVKLPCTIVRCISHVPHPPIDQRWLEAIYRFLEKFLRESGSNSVERWSDAKVFRCSGDLFEGSSCHKLDSVVWLRMRRKIREVGIFQHSQKQQTRGSQYFVLIWTKKILSRWVMIMITGWKEASYNPFASLKPLRSPTFYLRRNLDFSMKNATIYFFCWRNQYIYRI